MKRITHIGMRASGRVKCLVMQRGIIVKEYPWQHNLILNQGLNNVCNVNSWSTEFLNAAVGTGTTATSVASGAGVTATGTLTTFTNTVPGTFNWTTNAAVGDMIQMTSGANSGLEARITTITDANNVVYTPSQTMAVGEFAVYHTAQTGLTTETKRSATYLTGAGNCEGTLAGSIVTLKRTFDFTVEVGNVTYNEVGFSHVVGAGANLFSRIKLSVGVALVAGQSLRLVYSLAITLSPTTAQAATFSITGWPVAPSTLMTGFQGVVQPGLEGIVTGTGLASVAGYDGTNRLGRNTLEPSVVTNTLISVSPSSTAVATFAGAGVNRTTNATAQAVTLSTYTALDFFRDKATTYAVGVANRTDFRSMYLGETINAAGSAHECVFDQAQTKDSTHTLTLTWRITVGRTLA